MAVQLLLIAAELAASYIISRITAPDGPRLNDRSPDSGEYGIPLPRAYGSKVRVTCPYVAMADLDEDTHKLTDSFLGKVVFGTVGALFGPKYYTYSIPALALYLADRTNDDPIEGIDKVWANGKLIFNSATATVADEEFDVDGRLIWRKYKKNKFYDNLTLYTGHSDQPVDPNLENQDEISETSGHPFEAYFVIDDLQLEKFGNTPPTLEALFTVKTGQSFADVAESICDAAGIDPVTNLSSTALAEETPRGILINQESSCWDALKPLLPVFGADAAEVAGQIRFYKRSQTMRSVISLNDMGSHAFGDSPPDKFLFKRGTDITLPKETALTFIDPDRDYQTNTQSASRTEGDAKSNQTVSVPVVMTADEGATVAELMLWDAWLGRTALNFSLTDAWIGLAVGYAYGVEVGEQIVPYRITRRLRGANGIIEVEALSDESVTYTANASGSSGTIPDDDSTEIADTRIILIDGPIISDAHDDYGFYFITTGTDAGWDRGQVQASDDGVTYGLVADSDVMGTVGDVTGTLAAGTTTGLDDTLDTTSTLTVVLLHSGMELESATDAELDAGANLSFVGKDGVGEYLQFKTATFVSGTTWQLTNLRRGRNGTDWAIAAHASGEEFAVLDSVFRVASATTADWGNEFSFRGVTFRQDEIDADIQTFTNTGEGKRPYSPVNVEGTWDGSNNLTVTWDARSRMPDAGGLGADDNFEFDIEFFGSPDHTETVTAETATFSAAEQTAAGLTPGDTVTGRVRQTSDVNDGRWRDFTIIGPNAGLFLEDDLTPLELEDGSDFELG